VTLQVASLARAGNLPSAVASDVTARAEPVSRGLVPGTRAAASVDGARTRDGLSGRTLLLSPGVPLTVVEGVTAVTLRAPRLASVTDALDLAGVRLGSLDRVVARPDGTIASGDVIRVLRVTEWETVVAEATAYSVTTVVDASLTVGRSFVVTSGVPGLALNRYLVRTIDGDEVDRLLLSSTEVTAPVAEVRHIGTRPPPVPSEIEAIIRAAAVTWDADADQLLRVAWCESRYNPSAYNASSGTSGLFQFKPRTWAANSARAGYEGASVFDPVANANVAAYMFANLQSGQWACK
jgi:hypothetical protein